MDWLDATLIEPIGQEISAVSSAAGPTNPSSLVLALIGVGTLMLFGFGRRSQARRQAADEPPPATQSQTDDRRAA